MSKKKPTKPQSDSQIQIPPGAVIYGVVSATDFNGSPAIDIHGIGGYGTSLKAKKGAVEVLLPSASIIGISPGQHFVAWDGANYLVMPNMESIQETDHLTLIGSVAVPPFGLLADKFAASGIDIASGSPLLIMAAAWRGQQIKGIEERPPLAPILCDQIDHILYKVDQRHYKHLATMQVPHEIPPGEPRPPKMPAQLLNSLQWYASVLFTREVEQYGSVRTHARYEFWLSQLAERIAARVVDAVDQVDKGSTTASLKYHGLLRVEMDAGLKETLSALVTKYVWEQSPEFLKMKAQLAESPVVQAAATQPAEEAIPTQTDRKALRDSYRASFPDVGIMDICWAAKQHYREWARWLKGELKDDSRPDRAFRKVLESRTDAKQLRKEIRPKNWK